MYRSRLIKLACASLTVLSFACKTKTEQKTEVKTEAPKTQTQGLLDVPQDKIYAASAHIRIVDAAAGQVTAGIDLQRAVNAIVFTQNGLRGFVAASDGVREIDPVKQTIKAKLTNYPARSVTLSEDDSKLYVLEHEVVVQKNGTREVKPFRLKTIDLGKSVEESSETIGPGIFAVLPAYSPELHHLVISDARKIRLVAPGAKLSEGKTLDLTAGFDSDRIFGMRPYLARSPDGKKAYLPVEGIPSRVAQVDLKDGTISMIDLQGQHLLRGIAVSADGKTLVVNASTKALKIELNNPEVIKTVDLGGHHMDVSLSTDGRRAYFAKPIHEKGGAISVVHLDKMKLQGLMVTPDISPWVLAVRPQTAYASVQ